MNLETYLKENYQQQIIDHTIRAEVAEDGTVSFYIHAHGHDSDTLDFVVTANQLHPKYVIDDMKALAAANLIPPEIRARMEADRAAADSANKPTDNNIILRAILDHRQAADRLEDFATMHQTLLRVCQPWHVSSDGTEVSFAVEDAGAVLAEFRDHEWTNTTGDGYASYRTSANGINIEITDTAVVPEPATIPVPELARLLGVKEAL